MYFGLSTLSTFSLKTTAKVHTLYYIVMCALMGQHVIKFLLVYICTFLPLYVLHLIEVYTVHVRIHTIHIQHPILLWYHVHRAASYIVSKSLELIYMYTHSRMPHNAFIVTTNMKSEAYLV